MLVLINEEIEQFNAFDRAVSAPYRIKLMPGLRVPPLSALMGSVSMLFSRRSLLISALMTGL
ncbi:MAG TPA: hypothetical protein VK522_15420, partial [Pseudolabrys sp.]|nr:hypothetical protein [Pseudolabrys sp.]